MASRGPFHLKGFYDSMISKSTKPGIFWKKKKKKSMLFFFKTTHLCAYCPQNSVPESVDSSPLGIVLTNERKKNYSNCAKHTFSHFMELSLRLGATV